MIEICNLQKTYDRFALDCSLEVKPGRVTGLIGQNGAGKSTTFKAMLGLIRPDGGEITLLGKSLSAFTPADRENLGVVLSDSGFSGYQRIRDLLPMLKALYRRFAERWFLSQAEKQRLPMDKQIKEFSTGMKGLLIWAASMAVSIRIMEKKEF